MHSQTYEYAMASLARGRRAVAPIVSAMLMVLVVVAAFSLIWAYTDSWVRSQRAGPALAPTERLLIEDAWFGSSNVTIYVSNWGRSPVVIVDVGVYNASGRLTNATVDPPRLTLGIGQLGAITVTFAWDPPGPWDRNTAYRVMVVTERGSVVEAWFKA